MGRQSRGDLSFCVVWAGMALQTQDAVTATRDQKLIMNQLCSIAKCPSHRDLKSE